MATLKKFVQFIDAHAERIVMLCAYTFLSTFVFFEVVRRFLFRVQTPWGSSVSIYAFIWLAWMATAYCLKYEAHLRFGEIRARFSYKAKFACFLLDDLCWLIMAVIILQASGKQIALQIELGMRIPGTQQAPLWLATSSVLVGWGLIVVRVVQNVVKHIKTYRAGAEFTFEEGFGEADTSTAQTTVREEA
jgi:TRAP-type C4-dicarboxylate transport system permease small subunit